MGTTGLHVLGGALQGFGQGLVQQAQFDWQERRELAMQKLRGEQDAASDQRKLENAKELAKTNSDLRKDELTHGAAVEVETEARKLPTYEKKAKIDADSKIRVIGEESKQRQILARIQGDQDRLTAKARDALDNDDYAGMFAGDDGNWRIITKDAKVVDTGVKATTKELRGSQSSTTGSLIEEVRAARGGNSSPAPATTRTEGTAPPRRRDGMDNSKTYTMADVRATARSSGKSEEEVKRAFTAAGYKLTGG